MLQGLKDNLVLYKADQLTEHVSSKVNLCCIYKTDVLWVIPSLTSVKIVLVW